MMVKTVINKNKKSAASSYLPRPPCLFTLRQGEVNSEKKKAEKRKKWGSRTTNKKKKEVKQS